MCPKNGLPFPEIKEKLQLYKKNLIEWDIPNVINNINSNSLRNSYISIKSCHTDSVVTCERWVWYISKGWKKHQFKNKSESIDIKKKVVWKTFSNTVSVTNIQLQTKWQGLKRPPRYMNWGSYTSLKVKIKSCVRSCNRYTNYFLLYKHKSPIGTRQKLSFFVQKQILLQACDTVRSPHGHMQECNLKYH